MAKKFEIFISYRREGGFETARLLFDRLRLEGYSVSFDIDTLEKGNFDDELESRVKTCKDFLLVLNPGAFDRFFNPECNPKDDWVRREIVCALEENKNIVPLFLDGFAFPKQPLPPDVKDIARKNGIDLHKKHFEGQYNNLKKKFLISQPRWTTKHKKKIITALSVAFLAIAACLYIAITESMSEIARQKEQEFQLAKLQMADSIAREMRIKDSIIRHNDLAANAQQQKPQQQQKSQQASKAVDKTKKSLHCAGSNDRLTNIVCEKLAPAGVKKTECSGGGIKINVTPKKADCKSNALGEVACSYSPKLKFTDCNGTQVSPDLEMPKIASKGTDDNKARKEIEEKLNEADFSQWVKNIYSIFF